MRHLSRQAVEYIRGTTILGKGKMTLIDRNAPLIWQKAQCVTLKAAPSQVYQPPPRYVPMQAIEFETTLHNGMVTLPPEQATEWEGQAVRVIVLNPADAPTRPESITPPSPSLLSQLRQIKISAPPDFSANVDAYLNGGNDV